MDYLKNAYLIVCPSQKEADIYADGFLRSLLCEKKSGCGICPPCRKFDGLTHPDVMRVGGAGSIKVEEVRRAIPFIAQRAYEGELKAVVVSGAQQLTAGASNALLKSLEEPAPNTVFVLTANSAGFILNTVVSRCSVVRVKPGGTDCVRRVMEASGVDEGKAALSLSVCGGYPNAAAELAADAAFWETRVKIFEMAAKLCSAKGHIFAAHVDYLAGLKEGVFTALDILSSCFADMARQKAAPGKARLTNYDYEAQIQETAARFTTGRLGVIIDTIAQAERAILKSVNLRLALERMFIKILEEVLG